MSYEYRLIFTDVSSARHVMDVLRASAACIRGQGQEICLKDSELKSSAEYDACLMQEDEKSLWLKVNFRSPCLYRLLQDALEGRPVRCFEDGDIDDEVTLKEAFRIKGEN
ncbi:hypothetical protein [Paraburkholderia sp. ZP32-5]|uniref:hypothetical protein n=1 Tax=Paraburkholderia sp. ZP32-5 TaxID=2883245 RepID=UPI001F32CD42|nr:hypothetical protein [Paraburkholderia sp. ZP32-5]